MREIAQNRACVVRLCTSQIKYTYTLAYMQKNLVYPWGFSKQHQPFPLDALQFLNSSSVGPGSDFLSDAVKREPSAAPVITLGSLRRSWKVQSEYFKLMNALLTDPIKPWWFALCVWGNALHWWITFSNWQNSSFHPRSQCWNMWSVCRSVLSAEPPQNPPNEVVGPVWFYVSWEKRQTICRSGPSEEIQWFWLLNIVYWDNTILLFEKKWCCWSYKMDHNTAVFEPPLSFVNVDITYMYPIC